jgi:rhodanese-related sulfurtransferase
MLVIAAAFGLGRNALGPEPLPWTGTIGGPGEPEPGAGLPSVSAPEAAAAWEGGTFFLDVRSRDSFEERRVSGALPLPIADLENAYFDAVAPLGAEFPVLVYGAGADSFEVRRAAQYLLDLGHADVSLAVCGVEGLITAGVDPAAGPAEELW